MAQFIWSGKMKEDEVEEQGRSGISVGRDDEVSDLAEDLWGIVLNFRLRRGDFALDGVDHGAPGENSPLEEDEQAGSNPADVVL